jgi:hypothetical protein
MVEKQAIDPYLKLVIETTAEKTAQAVIEKHQASCQVNELKTEIWGDGTKQQPGLKLEVHDLSRQVQGIRDCKRGLVSFVRDRLAAPVIVAVIVALITGWMLSGRPSQATVEKPRQISP